MSISSTRWRDGLGGWSRSRSWPTVALPICILSALFALGPSTGSAQPVPIDTTSLAEGPYATMHTLFEKTIFKVDVLTLDLRFGPEVARQLEGLVRTRAQSSGLADSIASVAVAARDAWARIEFQRDVSLGQFLDGVRENLGRAREAGFITPETYEMVSDGLPRWFAVLEERGIRDGDEILYRIRGDTLRTVFRGADGRILVDQTDAGPERRLAVLGSYFAPKSDFRKGLIRSLFETVRHSG